jgi:hypothetical protein
MMRELLLGVYVPFVIAGWTTSPAQDGMPVEAPRQVALIKKVAEYDYNAKHRSPAIRVGIVFLPTVAESVSAKDQIAAALTQAERDQSPRTSDPYAHVVLPYSSADDLARALDRDNVNVLYVTPGLDSVLADILRVSRARKILSMTGQPSYVDKGVTVGFGAEQNYFYCTVNLHAMRQEGTDFDGRFLEKVKTR